MKSLHARFVATVIATAVTVACGGSSSPTAPTSTVSLTTLATQTITGSVKVLYNFGTPIAGFQFLVTGADVTGAGGGTAEATGFSVSTGNNIVLGFSFAGATIPAGNGVLVVLEVAGSGDACLTDLVISDSSASALDASVEDCLTISAP